MKKSRIEEKRMKIVICDDSKDDLEQTLPECLDDILREDDIIYIETSRHKNVFYTAGQTYSIYKKMDELEAELAGMGFVRIHQSFLINMRYIGKLSSYVMVLTTGKEISVPKSRYPEVKRQYTLFKGAE
jgi:DNA-binding LytR/AlgR family response regulator